MRKIQLLTSLLLICCMAQAQPYIVSTYGGTGLPTFNNDNIQATAANLNYPSHMDFDAAGHLYFADFNHARIRKINTGTGVITTAAGNGSASYGGDGGQATAARMSQPAAVAFDTAGNMFIAAYNDCHIRRVDAATGIITTIAGTSTIGFSGDGGPSTSAQIHYPVSIRTDRAGNVYFTDNFNHRLRKIDVQTGNINTICGTNLQNFNGNNIQASTANLGNPQGIAIDASGNIFIAETGNHRIRKITASTGIITTVAGNGTSGYSGDGGAATAANINAPNGVAVDAAGNIYIADNSNHIRKVNITTGIITTIAGTGTASSTGDGGLATAATFNVPQSISVGSNGKIYVGETNGLRIRVLTPCTAPLVTSPPSARTSCGSFTTSFAASASGTAPAMQWQVSVNGGVSFSNIAGATSSPLSFSADSTMDGYRYRAVFTNGCGSDTSVSALLRVYRIIGSTVSAAICSGASYEGYSAAGTYTDHFTSVTGCDSARTLILTVNPLPSITLGAIAPLCYSDSPQVALLTYTNASQGNNVFTISGNGYGTYRNIPLFSSPIAIPIPAGQAPGTYTGSFVMTNTNTGCSSAPITISNTIYPVSNTSISASICAGSSYGRHTVAGTYVDTFGSMYGCDSIVMLSLTILANASRTINATICAGQSYEGYTVPGSYTDHFRSANGCDSARTLILMVNPNVTSTVNASICAGQSYAGHTAAGTYTDHYTSANGCDSARTLTLIVNQVVIPAVSITADRTDLCNTYPMDTFRPAPINGGSSPSYVWYKNGVMIASNGGKLGYMMINDNDSIWCIMTSNAACANPNTAVSNKIVLNLIPTVTPSVAIAASASAFCGSNTRDTFTISSMANAGATPTYRWFKNGSVFSTSTVYVAPSLSNGDSIWLQLSSSAYCAGPLNVLSNRIYINVGQSVSSTITTSICAGSSYAGHTASGTYTDHYTSASGCDSARTLNLMVSNSITSSITASICAGQSYAGHTASGTYTDHYTSAAGCDSARILNLTVNPNVTYTVTTSICAGQSYAGHTVSGTYTDHYTSAAGCDSARTLNLTVNPNVTYIVTTSICAGQSYAGHTASGTYTDHYTSAAGCDSARTLNLTVNPNVTYTVTTSICAGQSYAGHTASGTYTDHYTSAAGCDSTRTLNLTVNPNVTYIVTTSICAGQSYAGHTASGTYTDHYTSAAGCDSARTLNLTVRPAATSTITATINNGQSYTVGTHSFNATGTYTVTLTAAAANGCDSVVTLNLTVQGTTCTASVSVSCNNTNLDVQSSRVMTAMPTNGGNNPVYNWYMNGALVSGIHGSVLSYGGALGNGDQIYCTMAAVNGCGANQTATSNTITFTKSGSTAKDIVSFLMPAQVGTSAINNAAATVSAVVTTAPAQRTAIHPIRITVSTGAAYSPSYITNRDFSMPVTYTVRAQDGSSRVWTATVLDQSGNKTTASTIEAAATTLTVYPNPASDHIVIKAAGGTDAAVITILDAEGRVMYHDRLPVADMVNHMVDVSPFAPGIYLVHVVTGDRMQTQQFIIK